MAKDAILHVRVSPEDKEQAEKIYADSGTSLSEATRMFIRQSIKLQGLPFRPILTTGKGRMKAQGILRVYAHKEMRETEREAWIRSLSDKYASLNR